MSSQTDAIRIPLFNTVREIALCSPAVEGACKRVLESGIFVNGPEADAFEKQFANTIGALHAVGVGSGTAGLEILLRADNVPAGRRISTTAHTFAAVVEAILSVNAVPELVDIDDQSWQMPMVHANGNLAIVPHMYGSPSPAFNSIASEGYYEDASQSFGAAVSGRPVGRLGRAAVFSCHPTKNVSAVGDAGVIVTDDADLAGRLRAIRNHGQRSHQVHELWGTTARLDEIQAAVLLEKLNRFPCFSAIRRRLAERYYAELEHLPVRFPKPLAASVSVPNLFVLRTERRDLLRAFLNSHGVATGVHYPAPIHKMAAYSKLPWAQVELPRTEALAAEIVTIPLWVGMACHEQTRVIEAMKEFWECGHYRGHGAAA